MDNQHKPNHVEFLSNLKINLEFIEAYFRHLTFEKKGDLTFALTYYSQDTLEYKNIDEIISELKSCIAYQMSTSMEIDIAADLNVQQVISYNGKDISIFHHGQLLIYYNSAVVYWNSHWETPSFEMRLETTISAEIILSFFKNFHVAIADKISWHE